MVVLSTSVELAVCALIVSILSSATSINIQVNGWDKNNGKSPRLQVEVHFNTETSLKEG